jgi:hypothetical protein
MTDRELLQQALDALESWQKTCLDCGRSSEELGRATKPLQAIRTRLAQPEPEPDPVALYKLARRCLWIAYVWNDHNFDYAHKYARETAEECGVNSFDDANDWLMALPKQREWVGLTDKEIKRMALTDTFWFISKSGMEAFEWGAFAKAIEAKLKEKNGD